MVLSLIREHGVGRSYVNEEGFLHREGGPAIIFYDGGFTWYKDGVVHRDDGPAVVHPNGMREWWENGEMIRRDPFPHEE